MLPSADLLNILMQQALIEARQAKSEGEVPIGAVLAIPVNGDVTANKDDLVSGVPSFEPVGICPAGVGSRSIDGSQAFQIIARGHNRVEQTSDATAHAEIAVIRKASSLLSKWRLSEAVLCVTLEPCLMCVGAIRLARIGCVVFGACDSRMGGMGTVADFANESRLGPAPEVIKGVCEEECRSLLKEFFRELRS